MTFGHLLVYDHFFKKKSLNNLNRIGVDLKNKLPTAKQSATPADPSHTTQGCSLFTLLLALNKDAILDKRNTHGS